MVFIFSNSSGRRPSSLAISKVVPCSVAVALMNENYAAKLLVEMKGYKEILNRDNSTLTEMLDVSSFYCILLILIQPSFKNRRLYFMKIFTGVFNKSIVA